MNLSAPVNKLNCSKGTLKSAITQLEQFITETTNKVTTNVSQLQIKFKKAEILQIKLEQIKDQYFDMQDMQVHQLQEIEADIGKANYDGGN